MSFNLNNAQTATLANINQIGLPIENVIIRNDTPLIRKSRAVFFTNPLSGRTILSNTRSRNRVNRLIRLSNEELQRQRNFQQQQQQQNKFISATVIGGLSTYFKLRIRTQNINNIRELYTFIRQYLYSGRGGLVIKYITLYFVSNQNNRLIGRTINTDFFEGDLEILDDYINALYNGASIGSDAINNDEFILDLSRIDFLYLQSGIAMGDSSNIIFENENVNNIVGNKPNECIKNSLLFIGHTLPKIKNKFINVINSDGNIDVIQQELEIKNITFLIKYIEEKNLSIDIISNIVYDINYQKNLVQRESFLYGKYNFPKFGYKLNKCEYRLKYIHMAHDKKKADFTFVYDSKNLHIDVIKNNIITIKDNVFIDKFGENFITIDNKIKIINSRREVYEEMPRKEQNDVVYIFFDYETVIDWKINNCMREYSLSWFYLEHNELDGIIELKKINTPEFELNIKHCFNEVGFDCSIKFIEWFNTFQHNRICKFVSYNGASFDNYFLLNAMLEYQKNNENIIKISDLLYSGNQLLNFKINGSHSMYDLHKHLIGSLKNNCESFKIPKKYSKLDCNHKEIQMLYNNDESNFINIIKQKEALILYNNNDVFSLCCLFIKYYDSMTTIKGFNFLIGEKFTDTGTIGSMIMKRAKNHWEEKKIILPKLTYQQYNDVLKYKIAGRVEIFGGKPIKLNEEVVSLDICSLYPYIMAIHECYMPSGEIKEVENYQGDDILGFYYCDIDQRALKAHNLPNIYAEKTETENKWDSQEILKDYLITNITIKLLKKYENIGVICDIKKGFIFSEKTRNIDMFNFLMPLMAIKNKEDDKKRNKDAEYNPALRECVKLLMNSVSGKVIEGLHSENIKMISNEDDLLKLQSKLVKNKITDLNIINNVGNNLFVSYKIDEESIINKQKPVYLGAFIYEYARSYMYENLLSIVGLDKCLYMDTDALKFRKSDLIDFQNKKGNQIVNHWEDVELIDPRYKTHKIYDPNSKVFGSLENELSENNLFYALQKKFWLVANVKDGEVKYIKTRYKGINPSSLLLENNCNIFDNKKEKNILNIQGLKLFDWIQNNQNLIIGSDFGYNEGFLGQQIKLFETLYTEKQIIVLVENMRRVVKNSLRSVDLDEKERYNIYNNTVQINYMLKTIKIN